MRNNSIYRISFYPPYAKTIYDTFCKEYSTSMGTKYKYSFMEIIEGEVQYQ